MRDAPLHFKLADQPAEFEAIHRLNHATFAEEIPQHTPHPDGRLVDRFHAENTYAICLHGSELVGMIAGRAQRPFSLDGKLPDLDRHLPAHRRAVEVRLLAVQPHWRKQAVFARLAGLLGAHFRGLGCDLAVISGTVRERRLYAHLGFTPFGPEVGAPEARYQPMLLPLADYTAHVAPLELRGPPVNLRPGPVALSAAVLTAHAAPPISHRSTEHLARVGRVSERLCALTGAAGAVLLPGGGTLANDAVAAQLAAHGGAGLVLSQGEFGERLADHARRWRLPHRHLALPWGQPLDLARLREQLAAQRPAWLWATACETSVGLRNPVPDMAAACAEAGTALCLDAISALGGTPLGLSSVWLASSTSGKALGSLAGLGLVLHDGRLAPPGSAPRALDLASWAAAGGVAGTQPSGAVAALDAALDIDWPARWQAIAEADARLRAALAGAGLPPLIPATHAQPGVLTLALPPGVCSQRLGRRLERQGLALGYESDYLRQRGWVQACLMGDVAQAIPPAALELLPRLMARAIARQIAAS